MALQVSTPCTGCGDCTPVCPNGAIVPAAPVVRIVPLLCTECVGYSDYPACVAACRWDAIRAASET